MDERTTGIILRTRLLTETSLIVHWLTADLGRVTTVAKGARRPKSPYRGKLDLFYLADFSFSRSAKSELHNLREVVLLNPHSALRENMGWLQQVSYCTAFIEQTTETESPMPAVFGLVRELLAYIPTQPPDAKTIFAFELKMLDELGLKPDLAETRLGPGTRGIVEKLTHDNWPAMAPLKLSEPQNDELRRFLHGFLIYHLGKLPRGRAEALNLAQ